ncbi:MAG: PadR family transcriptional regulator [Acidobacteriota bacterium]
MAKPLTPAVFHVLLALAQGPLHGYAIMQAARESAQSGSAMGPGTIYGTLDRLLGQGWVRELSSDDARKRVFELTGRGDDALRTEAQRILSLADVVRRRQILTEEGA